MRSVFLLILGACLALGCGDTYGTCYTYYGDGETVRSEVPCNRSKGTKDGLMKVYRKNGELWKTIPYVNGVEEDTTRLYYSHSDKLLKIVPMEGGKREGSAIEYYRNGEIKKIQPYEDNKKSGLHKTFTEKGKLISEEYYKNGLKEKTATYYYEDSDQVKEKISYIQDNRNGAYVKYDSKGRLLLEGAYKNGLPTGKWTFRSSIGKPITADIAEIKYAYKEEVKGLDEYFYEQL